MLVNRLPDEAIHKMPLGKGQLRAGQIIQGKILKLYPGQHATIQVGSEKWHAQLKAPLTKGVHYHFKVEQSGSPFILKVVGEALGKKPVQNAHALLEQLGFASSKQRAAVITELIKSHIPFGKEQLEQAFELLEKAGYKKEAQTLIKLMIAAKLPLNDSVFAAVQSTHTSTFSQEIQAISQNPVFHKASQETTTELLNRLQWLTGSHNHSPSELLRQMMNEVSEDNPNIFRIIKASGAIDPLLDFETWKKEWSQFMNTHTGKQPALEILSHQTRLPFAINTENIASSLKQLEAGSIALYDVFRNWESVVKNAVAQHTKLPDHVFYQLRQSIQHTSSQLSLSQQNQLNSLLTNQIDTLQALQIYMDAVINQPKIAGVSLSIQERFLAHIDTMLNHAGLTHESLLASDGQDVKTSVKSLLIQLVQQQDQTISERAQPLLNLINGLQLNSVRESPYIIQAALQLPGEKIGLHEDILLEFNGRKRKNGTIDPGDCSILFHLNLAHLKETVIDMHIQKRTVALTIWNEQSVQSALTESFKPALRAGLESLDYQLTRVTFKQATDKRAMRAAKESLRHHPSETPYERVDLRI